MESLSVLCEVSNCAFNWSPDFVAKLWVSKIDLKQIWTRNSTWQERSMIAFARFLVENDATWLKPERPNCIRRHGCCILKFHIQQSRYSNNALIGIILSAPSVPRVSICNKKSIYPHDALSLPSPARQPTPFPLSFAPDLDMGGGELFFVRMCVPLTGWTRCRDTNVWARVLALDLTISCVHPRFFSSEIAGWI